MTQLKSMWLIALILCAIIPLSTLCQSNSLLPAENSDPRESRTGVVPLVVILLYVNTDLLTLQRCVTSIERHQDNEAIVRQKTIFVDDGSPTEVLKYEERLCKSDPLYYHCAPTDNNITGFPFAVNRGINHAEELLLSWDPSVSTLDSDAFVVLRANSLVTDSWIRLLRDELFNPEHDIGITVPVSNAAKYQSVPRIHDNHHHHILGVNSSSSHTSLTHDTSSSSHATQQSSHKSKSAHHELAPWSHNPFPPGVDLDHMARELQRFGLMNELPPVHVAVFHSLCFMVKRSVVQNVGLMHFPAGNEAEIDYALRVMRAGLDIAIIPDVYIYNDKSKFRKAFADKPKHEASALREDAQSYLAETYGDAVKELERDLETIQSPAMEQVRNFVGQHYRHVEEKYPFLHNSTTSILFVLHEVAVGGGVVSILQESLQMLRFGVNVKVSIPEQGKSGDPMTLVQAMLPSADRSTLEQLVVLHKGSTFYPEPFSEDFMRIAKQFDVVVATYCLTMQSVSRVAAAHPHIMPAYYVQDYEPWTWYSPFTPQNDANSFWVKEARSTYTANNRETFMFAKTRWTAYMVRSNHDNAVVHRVTPSVDHEVYYPNRTELALKLRKVFGATGSDNGPHSPPGPHGPSSPVSTAGTAPSEFRILAMIRPRTPRRNPELTLDVMLRLAYEFKKQGVSIYLFGSKVEDMLACLASLVQLKGQALHRSESFMNPASADASDSDGRGAGNVHLVGLVTERTDIAKLYRRMDIFIDLSWWQAFGRAGIEAMACGTVAVMPLTGAAPDICKNQEYCLYHDGQQADSYYNVVVSVLKNDTLRHNLVMKGIEKSRHFNLQWAAASMANAMMEGYHNWRLKHP